MSLEGRERFNCFERTNLIHQCLKSGCVVGKTVFFPATLHIETPTTYTCIYTRTQNGLLNDRKKDKRKHTRISIWIFFFLSSCTLVYDAFFMPLNPGYVLELSFYTPARRCKK